ncbi:hypothetical protein Clacol_003575 [Clathrus columnatus]|uniref:Uncharacterized protein n=1 Tax=Clathrus columnatus TaxID=1419009 RepID=A0AAV5A821_9AGAM|nr:hypothetical protein Clacol_003575 [Clathrus columnatus]
MPSTHTVTEVQCDFPGPSLTSLQCSTNSVNWKKTCRLVLSEKRSCNHNEAPWQGFTLDFQAEEITLYSVSLSSTLGAADIYVDSIWSGRMQLVPHNTPWTQDGLDIKSVHNLTVLPMSINQNSFPLELFVLTLSVILTP